MHTDESKSRKSEKISLVPSTSLKNLQEENSRLKCELALRNEDIAKLKQTEIESIETKYKKQTGELETRIVSLCKERSKLLKIIETEKQKLEILTSEMNVIPEYIQKYHKERISLKEKFREKERIIELQANDLQLMNELCDELKRKLRLAGNSNDIPKCEVNLQVYKMIDFKQCCSHCKGRIIDI